VGTPHQTKDWQTQSIREEKKMSDCHHEEHPGQVHTHDSEPSNPARRLFLASSAVVGAGGALIAGQSKAAASPSHAPSEGLGKGWSAAGSIIESDQSFDGMDPPDSEIQRIADLIVANHILADQDFNDMFGHVSVRSLRNPGHFYMSKSRAPELVIPEDIMEFDSNSAPLDQRGRVMYEERYIHGEIYRVRPDVMSVIHSHTPAVLPFGLANVPLRPIIHTASFLPDEVPLFEIRDVEGENNSILVTNQKSGAALAKKLDGGPAILMRGHGCTVVGKNVRLAVYHALYLKKSAETQLAAMSLGRPLTYLNAHERANFGPKLERMGTTEGPIRGWPVWERRALANLKKLLGA
jgi:ribulose-5-phosphate 4-epimerase/fuculose-1-phosphate aldolase